MSPLWLNHIYSVLSALTWRPMPAAARSRLCSSFSDWASVFARSAMSSALSAPVIVFAGYLQLLSFVSLNVTKYTMKKIILIGITFESILHCTVVIKDIAMIFISNSWAGQTFGNIFGHSCFQRITKQFKPREIPTLVGSIKVVGTQTYCGLVQSVCYLKATHMNEQQIRSAFNKFPDFFFVQAFKMS